MPSVTYFTCTLGQAAQAQYSRPFANINSLIDKQASNHPDFPAVGFVKPTKQADGEWEYEVLTFQDIKRGSLTIAEKLQYTLDVPSRATVGLLCSSSAEFLFNWLACIRLGFSVLLIAPQCSPSAGASLCKSCNVPILFADVGHVHLAEEIVAEANEFRLQIKHQPIAGEANIFETVREAPESVISEVPINDTDVAYFHHTSGTSSGTPKPVPQPHRAAVGVLPCLDGSGVATFTTTPMYHGGIADLFRAWTSNALIWFFPEKDIPVTSKNVIKCLEAADRASRQTDASLAKYFSSVPYVLQMLAEDKNGLRLLQEMDLVGVGGAALPSEIGDRLVDEGVNLVSRYGSVENGFTMNSHRDYEVDKDWQYLRHDLETGQLKFEQRADSVSELVIQSTWPHIAKTNREDRSYATSDLFEAHKSVANAWRYHSRADSLITLATGKKFDPAPIEDAINAATQMLQGVLVFGEGETYPGVLLFRSKQAAEMAEERVLNELKSVFDSVNEQHPVHARVSMQMLKLMPYSNQPLEKSSKGTILRGQAVKQYSKEIEHTYNKVTANEVRHIPDAEIQAEILQLIKDIVEVNNEQQLSPDSDLFAFGVDSIASTRIRCVLSNFLPKKASSLPLTIVEDSGTVSNLANVIIKMRHGIDNDDNHKRRENDVMELVNKFTNFDDQKEQSNGNTSNSNEGIELEQRDQTILLTGPTGFLGVHILSQALSVSNVSHVYVLVRGQTQHAARERVLKAFDSRSLKIPSFFDKKVTILTAKLSEPNFGLSEAMFRRIVNEVDVILHLAWCVNFLLPLRSFKQHLAGVRNMINLALASSKAVPPKFIFCSSIAVVSRSSTPGSDDDLVPEEISKALTCGPTGYARSKLVAELICQEATRYTRLKGRIRIIRVGQLSGDTQNGIWNHSEAYPLMLSSKKITNVLPDLGKKERLTWLPVDIAATCFIEGSLKSSLHDKSALKPDLTDEQEAPLVLHLGNFDSPTTFDDLLRVLKKTESFEVVPTDHWLSLLDQLEHQEESEAQSSLKLLAFWKTNYQTTSSEKDSSNREDLSPGSSLVVRYEMKRSLEIMSTLRSHLGVLEDNYLEKLWAWIKDNVR